MSAPSTFLDGSELVLVAQVPKAGNRWEQVHLNKEVVRRFFRLTLGATAEAEFERVARDGTYRGSETNPVVYSTVNKNYKVEFDFKDAGDYPDEPPILVVLELALRRFRYILLMPRDPGFAEMKALNESLEKVGQGHRRVITTLSEVEMRWPGCPLRSPRAVAG
jgi:hypothetical protein